MQHIRNFVEVELERSQIVREVLEAFHILRHFIVLGIGDEHDTVHAAQHQLPRGVVNDLAGHGVKLELRLEAPDRHRLDWQKIKEERAVGTRRQRDEPALLAVTGLDVVVNLDEIGRLAAHAGAVIDDLDLQLLGSLVNDGHKFDYFCFLRSNSVASASSCALGGSASPSRPNAAK